MSPTLTPAQQAFLDLLRSGEISQIQGKLRTPDGMCCLGVACEAYSRQESSADWAHDSIFFRFLGSIHLLPQEVAEWLGLPCTDPVLREDATAAKLNDNFELTFPEIADLFEAYFLRGSNAPA